MPSLNKILLIGHLGADPDVSYLADGTAVAKFSVATSYKPKDKEEVTEWHRCVAWSKNAELAGEYLKKGNLVYAEGRVQYRSYTDKEGVVKNTTDIQIDRFLMLEKREKPAEKTATASKPPVRANKDEEDLPF